jgi:hypothetical protein
LVESGEVYRDGKSTLIPFSSLTPFTTLETFTVALKSAIIILF